MQQREEPVNRYPLGRGYGHDYMRGGEVLGGYGYSERDEYEKVRGEVADQRASGARPAGDDATERENENL